MRKGGRLFIVVGIAFALVAAMLAITAFRGSGNGSSSAKADEKKVTVLQASHDIQASTVLRAEDIQTAQVPASTAPKDSPSSPNQVIGLATSGNLVKGQQIISQNLVTPGLTNIISNGKRAVALPVDRVSALGGMIRADDYVDIVYSTRIDLNRILSTNIAEEKEGDSDFKFQDNTLTVPPPGTKPPANYPYPGEDGSRFVVSDSGSGNEVTKVLLQNIKVLQVIAGDVALAPPAQATVTPTSGDSSSSKNSASSKLPNADMLVLEVDPQQAEIIKFLQDTPTAGQNQLAYQVMLRSADDHGAANTTGMTYDQLMSTYGLPAPKSVHLPGGGQ